MTLGHATNTALQERELGRIASKPNITIQISFLSVAVVPVLTEDTFAPQHGRNGEYMDNMLHDKSDSLLDKDGDSVPLPPLGIRPPVRSIDEGFDIPLFDNVFSVITQVSSKRTVIGNDTYDVFYVTTASTRGLNEALLGTPRGPTWRGEVIVLRHAKIHNGYVNLRWGDRPAIIGAVFR